MATPFCCIQSGSPAPAELPNGVHCLPGKLRRHDEAVYPRAGHIRLHMPSPFWLDLLDLKGPQIDKMDFARFRYQEALQNTGRGAEVYSTAPDRHYSGDHTPTRRLLPLTDRAMPCLYRSSLKLLGLSWMLVMYTTLGENIAYAYNEKDCLLLSMCSSACSNRVIAVQDALCTNLIGFIVLMAHKQCQAALWPTKTTMVIHLQYWRIFQ